MPTPTDDKTFSVKPDPTPMPNALPPDTMNPTRRRSSLFQSLLDNSSQPNAVERRHSISDQHRTPGFIGKMWKNYVMGSPDQSNPK